MASSRRNLGTGLSGAVIPPISAVLCPGGDWIGAREHDLSPSCESACKDACLRTKSANTVLSKARQSDTATRSKGACRHAIQSPYWGWVSAKCEQRSDSQC